MHSELVPCSILAAAALYGFCARHSIPFVISLHLTKVSDTSNGKRSRWIDNIGKGGRCRSIDNTSNGSRYRLIIDVSRSLGDLISELPDEILIDILSRLSLRDVMRVAALSKRWRNVCLAFPYLDLDWSVLSGFPANFHRKQCALYKGAYVNNVGQVLRKYKDQNILSFRFSFCLNKEYSGDVGRWMNFVATKEHLVSLSLQFICIDDYSSRCNLKRKPDELYSISDTFLSRFSLLKDLYLDSCILKLQGDVGLSKLATLSLNYVILEGTQWQCVLSSFSNIQWLRLRSCNLSEKLHIGANFWCLSFLMIEECPGLLEVELNAENLKTFEFVGKVFVRCTFVCAPKVENMYVFLEEDEHNGVESMFSNVANSLPSLTTLFLSGPYSKMYKLPTSPVTYFRSVLKLHLYMRDDDREADLVQVLPHLLESFPILKQLKVRLPHVCVSRKREELPAPYFHHHLQEIELGHFTLAWAEFASYLLESAIVLERLVIGRSMSCYSGCGGWRVVPNVFLKYEHNSIQEWFERVGLIFPNVSVTVVDCNIRWQTLFPDFVYRSEA